MAFHRVTLLVALFACGVAGGGRVVRAQQEADAAEKAKATAEAAAVEAVKAQAAAAANAADAVDPNSLAGKESTEGVYVRDSALALEKFALAQRMERLKEWGKSADLYQEVIERYPDRVVPSRTNDQDKIIQYTSVTRGVMERLARWPKEGLDVYRARFEPTAAGLVNAAGPNDLAEMHRVFYRYFVTDTAKKTGLRLVDVNLERGEFQSAARLADELIHWHPGLGAERPSVLYRAALAHRLAGDEAKAKERLATLQKNHADAAGTVRGKPVKLAESLAQELTSLTALGDGAVAASADAWTTFGGDPSRGRVAPAGGRPGARLFAVPLSRPQHRNLAAPNRLQLEQLVASWQAGGLMTGVFPVVDRGELFFQDGARVFARSLESGIALPGWAQTYPADRDGQYVLPNVAGAPRTHQLTLTLTDRAVLGVMGQSDRSRASVGQAAGGEARLVCLDRQTGRENWIVTLSGLELPKDLADDQQKSIRSLQMNGSPLVIGDSVLISARGVKNQQFEDCWVLCFHLATGKYRWGCYVASASTVGAMYGGGQGMGSENTAHLAYANGRVYVLSNLGALAALDAYSGTIVWLDIYERDANPFDPNQPFAPFNQNQPGAAMRKPWAYNPVIVKDGSVFVLPGEGRHLYVYDANTGAELNRIKRADFGNADVLVAAMGDDVIIAGEKKIFRVNWRKYTFADPQAALVWPSADFEDGIRGRPFVTADSVFVTDTARLYRLDLKGGRVQERKPLDEKEEGPGNLLVTADHVVIAGATHVYGYTDLTLARGRLDREVAAAPDDANPRLRYAEVMFTAGEFSAAIGKLDEAIKLLGGGGNAMRSGAARDRLFNDALAFAQKLGAPGAADAARQHAAALYDRAAAAAATPAQHVHYRLSRARFAEGNKDAPGAAGLYQQILSEPELRPVALLDEASGGPTQAAAVAEQAIRQLVARAGAGVYEPFEQDAAKQFEQAKAIAPAKPDDLLAVAQTYPNASVAPQALLAAADAYEAAGQPRPAVQVLRQMYFKYPDNPEKPRIIESIARNYLVIPNRTEVAAARLAQGAALPGDHKLAKSLRLPDGREIPKDTTFAQALDEVRKYRVRVAANSLPDHKLPVPPKYPPAAERKANPRWPFPPAGKEQVIEGIAAIATPLRDFARADRLIVRTHAGMLAVYKPGDAQPIAAPAAAMAQLPRGSAWLGDDALVWGSSTLLLLPGAGGKAAWQLDLQDLPALNVVKPGTAADVLPARGPNQQAINVQIIRRNNQAFIMRNGLAQQLPVPPGANAPPDPNAAEEVNDVRPVGDRVIIGTSIGRVFSIDGASGRVAWQTRLSDRPADRIVANEDFTVVKVSDETAVRLVAMDTFTGQIRGTRGFTVQSGVVPGNIALSAEGVLVYTMPDKLVLKDLYKPWDASDRDVTGGGLPGQAPGVLPYPNATGPDQLLIAEGRILALAESGNGQTGTNKKYVRVHSLETGQPITLRIPQEGGGMVDLQLDAGTESWEVKLRVIGPRLYVINPRTIHCYNLDRAEDFWEGWVDDVDDQSVPNIQDAFFGQKHVVLLSRPGVPTPRKGHYQLLAYARYAGKPGDTAESGRIDYEPMLVEKEPVTAWQGVEGGFYYLTGDEKLHFLAAQ